jgi:hypothetical protein
LQFKASPSKKLARPYLNKEGRYGIIEGRLRPNARQKSKTLSKKITKAKKDWGHDSSGRVPA